MICDLKNDINLRGYAFEFVSKVQLRRYKKNNFIFQTNLFQGIDEILDTYRLTVSKRHEDFIKYMREYGMHCDIISFTIDKLNRRIQEIEIFDVKTRSHTIKKPYFEMCTSGLEFFLKARDQNITSKIVSVVLFRDWKYSMNIIDFNRTKIREYTRFNQVSL
ncbi:hypothetical protein H6504_04045 [Candidatus Woesearchaeota archaeon]|nr:hypothetical protein [Candidatus Woesearchaeota archaeon]